MMKKRILALVLALCMVLAMMPTALAADGGPIAEYGLQDGELTQYNTVDELLVALSDEDQLSIGVARGHILRLLADISLKTDDNYGLGLFQDGIIDLNGHTLTFYPKQDGTDEISVFVGIFQSGSDCATIKNGTIKMEIPSSEDRDWPTIGIMRYEGALTIDNVSILAQGSEMDSAILATQDGNGDLTLKNCTVDFGAAPAIFTSVDESWDGAVSIISGSYKNLYSEDQLPEHVEIKEGSNELKDGLPDGVTGTVITSPDTTALIVKDGNAYLYDTLQDAVDAAKSKQTGSEEVQISLLKQPESTTVTVPADVPLNIKPLDSTGSAINTEKIKLESSTGEKLEITESGTVEAASIPVTAVTLGKDTLSLTVGETATLAATVEPENATDKTVTWTSSNEDVATVDEDGVVTAVAAGTATITVTAGGKTATCAVTVSAKVDPWYPPYIPVIPPVLPTQPTQPTQPTTPEVELPFLDVSVEAPYYEAVKYVYGLGLMVGTSDTAFSPNGVFTRAQVATILFRMENCPETAYAAVFPDVAEGQWFDQAIVWGNSKGILLGYDDGSFGPDNAVTLEQLLTILYRYAGSKDWDTAARADVTGYDCSDYAADAVSWAVANGLIDSGSALLLKQPAARWQVAVVLTVFCKTIIK